MNGELRKSLTDLIDETLLELEELKKSRYSASEMEIEGPGEGIAGKPSNGDLEAKKAEDDKDDEEDKDEAKKAEDEDEDEDEDEEKGGVHVDIDSHKMDKAEKKDKKEPHEEDPKHEEKEKKLAEKLLAMHKGDLKKSQEETESLLKSFVEERVKPLEDKLSTILDLVNRIADQPVQPKGVAAGAVPLMKSTDEGRETLSKSEVAAKLFELKKSGTKVDSLDIARAEMGQDLVKIVDKYKIS